MPSPKVKPLTDAQKNIEDAAGTVGARYTRGIDTGKEWKGNAGSDAAETLYGQATAEAISAKRRQRAIMSRNEDDWKTPAKGKGARNIGPAMRDASGKWVKNWGPYGQALSSVNMAEKTTDAMANIDGRLKPIVEALVAKKKELKG
jgi:hypothetical protein